MRNLERELGKIARKIATGFATGELQPPVAVTPESVARFLGNDKFDNEVAERTAVPGVATGLAVTGAGGDVLFVEATSMGEKVTAAHVLTGQLGDVMKESAQIALSFVRSHAADLGDRSGGGEQGFPPPRARRRGAEGRPFGRRHHDHRDREPAHRTARA